MSYPQVADPEVELEKPAHARAWGLPVPAADDAGEVAASTRGVVCWLEEPVGPVQDPLGADLTAPA